MNVLIVTLGSRGDVQPYVALGKGLKEAGHQVTICTSGVFQQFITNHGLDYSYMNNELIQLIDSDAGREAIENTNNLWGTIRTTMKLFKRVKPMLRQTLYDVWNAAQVIDPDVMILASKAAVLAESIADKLEIPLLMSMPFPQFVPSAQIPSLGFPDLKIGAWYNRFTYRIVHWAVKLYSSVPNEFRHKVLQLPPKPKHLGMLCRTDGSPIPQLHCYSKQVAPRPTDWPDSAYVNGYWFLDQLDDWQPPAELGEFLAAGDAPIYIGFGSMAGRHPQRLAKMAIEALQVTNQRGILATGWGGLQAKHLPETIFKLNQAPHDWLFPRVSAVVHHGGAGTTAAGLRAGCPTIICPFFGDQPFWGQRIHSLGVGPKPIPQKQLTAKKLAQAIREVTSNSSMGQKAKVLGEKIRVEDGIKDAIAIIETLARANKQ
ncbi:MAG: glycosyltransferase family 1 protein [Symploca sp. SIO2C1]|nr:glycosyltransferase family 1 protein [Symploca sp. SIO2C1]